MRPTEVKALRKVLEDDTFIKGMLHIRHNPLLSDHQHWHVCSSNGVLKGR